MKNLITGLLLFFLYLGALFVYPFATFIILMNKWENWVTVEINEILNNI